jgi:hypothetical protein
MPRQTDVAYLKDRDIEEVGQATLKLALRLSEWRRTEVRLLPVMFGFIAGRFGMKIHPEYGVKGGRIDFLYKGAVPTYLEVVVRSPASYVEHYGGANVTELHKLTRAHQGRPAHRVLMIIDAGGGRPSSREKLIRSYSHVPGPRGGGLRKPVRIVYVHPKCTFHFHWPVRGFP